MVPSVTNILNVYRAADSDSLREGLRWYNDAHLFAKGLDTDVNRSAGIIAALSPMNGWKNNKNKAALLYAQDGEGTKVGLFTNVAKAQLIYKGGDPNEILRGDKVRAFYRTILNPRGDIRPTVDRHAFDIAVGMRTNDKARGALSRKGVYESFADAYRAAAAIEGIGAAQMQASTWLFWRKFHGIVA